MCFHRKPRRPRPGTNKKIPAREKRAGRGKAVFFYTAGWGRGDKGKGKAKQKGVRKASEQQNKKSLYAKAYRLFLVGESLKDLWKSSSTSGLQAASKAFILLFIERHRTSINLCGAFLRNKIGPALT